MLGRRIQGRLPRPATSDLQDERLEAVEIDLTDHAETRRIAADLAGRCAVTHFVHNAGVVRPNSIPAAEPEDIEFLAKLHLGAPLVLLKAFLPGMKERREGRVILISSRAVLVATRTAYSATKAGIIGMARTWALELGPSGITVNVVAPGPIAQTRNVRSDHTTGSDKAVALARTIPVGRLGAPADVAQCSHVLCPSRVELRDRPGALRLRRRECFLHAALSSHPHADLLAEFRRPHDKRTLSACARRVPQCHRGSRHQCARARDFSADRDFGRLSEFRCAVRAVDNGLRAARKVRRPGTGSFPGPGSLRASFGSLGPLVGAGEATLLAGSQLGRRLGLVTLDSAFRGVASGAGRPYGIGGRIVHVTGMGCRPEDFSAAFSGDIEAKTRMLADFTACAAPAIAAGPMSSSRRVCSPAF